MLLSVIILSYNSERTLGRCLTSLEHALKDIESSEVFVVDNNSTDTSRDRLAFHIRENSADNISYHSILFPINTGTTMSRNVAMRAAKGKYILIIDSDAYVTAPAIHGLIARLEENKNIGMVCPRLTYKDGRHQLSTDTFPTAKRKFERAVNLGGITRHDLPFSGDVDYAISACWMLKKEVIDAVGFFDENIFYAPEDVDYCIRVWLAGYRIFYDTDESLTVVHDAQELSRKFKITKFHIEHIKGLLYLFKKYDCLFSLDKLRARIAVSQHYGPKKS